MMRAISRQTVERSLSAHAAIGLLASALLYLVCLTGTVLVFYEEWQRVEQPAAPEMDAVSPDAVQRGVAAVLATEKGKARTTHLYVHLPVDALPRATITTDTQAVHLDSKGAIAAPEENSWAEFLLALHYTLLLPPTVGIIIVGALGVTMIALSVTGILAHPRIFRDAFRFRARDTGGVGLADWHNRIGVWTLPFSLAIALTGAVIGLGTLNGYGLAVSFYGGDIEAAYTPIFGGEGKADTHPAPVPDVAAALRTMTARFPEVTPSYVVVRDPLTAGQHVQVIAIHPRRLIYGENYDFDAAGRFVKTTGLSDGAIGQQFAASNYDLHFGNFGGLPVKIAYFVFGLAVTIMIGTGVSIWLGKRRRRGVDSVRMANMWSAVVWGTPAALALCFTLRLLLGNGAPLGAVFWGSTALMLFASAVAIPPTQPARHINSGLG